jgi:hypothetical protein
VPQLHWSLIVIGEHAAAVSVWRLNCIEFAGGYQETTTEGDRETTQNHRHKPQITPAEHDKLLIKLISFH